MKTAHVQPANDICGPTRICDPRRLDAIARLELRGHLGDPCLDGVVQTLATSCRVPIAVINIVTPDLQTYPAETGVRAACTRVPDELSFCAEVVATGRAMQVCDARTHPVYAANPLVEAGVIGAYAGEPLVHDGHVIGVLSMFDHGPRVFTREELAVLAAQARLTQAVIALRADAAWDRLTSLATRSLLLDRIGRALGRAGRCDSQVAVLLLDVTGMAEINATFGSAAGDGVLRAVADRLQDACGPSDSAARIGGDEFAVLLEGLASAEEARARAAALASSSAGRLAVGAATVDVDLRARLACGPASDADALLAAAGRSATADSAAAAERQAQADELRRAIDDGELVLHYQPMVDLTGGPVVGVEALVRWQHPTRGLVPPSEFIALAEEHGLIDQLGRWVLRAGASQAAQWQRQGRPLRVSLNLSVRQLADPTLPDRVAGIVAETGVDPHLLCLELTESALMDQPHAQASLLALRDAGIGLSLDDFGTGYSSLTYLRRFPVDTIKIDRSFVAGLGRHVDDDAIVASIVSLARNTGKAVVAEGVETQAQAEVLRTLGVVVAQGFLWSRPLPADELAAWGERHAAGQHRFVPTAAAVPAPRAARALSVAEQRILLMHADGASLHTIAAALNADGARTEKGVRWHTRTVARVIAAGDCAPSAPPVRVTTAQHDVTTRAGRFAPGRVVTHT